MAPRTRPIYVPKSVSLNSNLVRATRVTVEGFTDQAEWTAINAGTTIANDTSVNANGELEYVSSPSIKISTGSNTLARYEKRTLSVDCRPAAGFELDFFLPQSGGITVTPHVYLSGDATAGWPATTYIEADFVTSGATGIIQRRWSRIRVPLSDWVKTGSGTLESLLTSVKTIRIQAGNNVSQDYVFDRFRHYSNPISCWSLIFDDGYSGVYTRAYPYMRARGMVGTVGVNSNKVGTAGYMTLAQLQELVNAGWIMVNHTADHSNLCATDVPGITGAQIQSQWTTCASYLTSNGLSTAAQSLMGIFPFGTYDDATILNTIAAGITTCRSVDATNDVILPFTDKYYLPAKTLDSSRTLVQAKAAIDTAITRGECIQMFTHDVLSGGSSANSNSWPEDLLFDLINYAIRRQLPHITTQQLTDLNSVPVVVPVLKAA